MLIGDFAAARSAKRAAPDLSLGVLVAATQWLDLASRVLLLAGIERAGSADPWPLVVWAWRAVR